MTNFQPVRLAYISHEPVTGTDPGLAPLLFLHGATGFKEYWEDIPQIAADASKRKAYSIDARNHGDSEWSDYFNFDVNVDDLIHFMDMNEISKAIIVGHSMGGMTAIKTALRRPERVEKIFVEDMPVGKISKEIVSSILGCFSIINKAPETAPPNLDDEGIKKYIVDYLMKNMPPEMMKLHKTSHQTPEDMAQFQNDMTRFFQLRRDADATWHWKSNMDVIQRAFQDLDTLSEELQGSFEGPVCFIYGQLSPFNVGGDAQNIKQFFPNAEMVEIKDGGHSIHFEKKQEFMDILLKFIC